MFLLHYLIAMHARHALQGDTLQRLIRRPGKPSLWKMGAEWYVHRGTTAPKLLLNPLNALLGGSVLAWAWRMSNAAALVALVISVLQAARSMTNFPVENILITAPRASLHAY
jgi:hypothetical protein